MQNDAPSTPPTTTPPPSPIPFAGSPPNFSSLLGSTPPGQSDHLGKEKESTRGSFKGKTIFAVGKETYVVVVTGCIVEPLPDNPQYSWFTFITHLDRKVTAIFRVEFELTRHIR